MKNAGVTPKVLRTENLQNYCYISYNCNMKVDLVMSG